MKDNLWLILAILLLILHLTLFRIAAPFVPFELLGGVGITALLVGYFAAVWAEQKGCK